MRDRGIRGGPDQPMINRAMIPFNIAGGPDPTPIAAALALFFLWQRERDGQSTL